MSDPIKINLYDPIADKELWHIAENFQGREDTAYVFGHDSPTQIADYSKGRAHAEYLSPLELAQRLDKEGATRESRIFLFACTTGQDEHSFARELSQHYYMVAGATRQIWSRAHNETEFYAEAIIAGPDRQGQPDENNRGKMKIYFGRDYQFCNTHAQECDSPQSERPPPTHEFKVFGATLTIKEADIVSPVTLFRPDLASNPISPDDVIQQRKVEANIFLNIVELKGVQAQLAMQQAVHHYPELAYAFAAFDYSVQHSKGRSDSKEQLGERVAAILLAIEQGETYTLDIGVNAKIHASPTVAAEAQAHSR